MDLMFLRKGLIRLSHKSLPSCQDLLWQGAPGEPENLQLASFIYSNIKFNTATKTVGCLSHIHSLKMNATLSRSEAWSLLTLALCCFAVIFNAFQDDGAPLIVSLALSGLAFCFTYSLIRWLGPTFIAAGLKGKDMSKAIKKEMYVPKMFSSSLAD